MRALQKELIGLINHISKELSDLNPTVLDSSVRQAEIHGIFQSADMHVFIEDPEKLRLRLHQEESARKAYQERALRAESQVDSLAQQLQYVRLNMDEATSDTITHLQQENKRKDDEIQQLRKPPQSRYVALRLFLAAVAQLCSLDDMDRVYKLLEPWIVLNAWETESMLNELRQEHSANKK